MAHNEEFAFLASDFLCTIGLPQDTPRNHHFVPASYLNAWVDPGPPTTGTVWTFGPDGANPEQKSPRSIMFRRDLYSLQTDDADIDVAFETGYLQGLDRDFARVRQATFYKDKWPAEDQWRVICEYIAVLFIRAPHYLEHLKRRMS